MSGTTENIPHRILFSRIPRDITDLISLLLHFSHCSRHRNMSFRSLFVCTDTNIISASLFKPESVRVSALVDTVLAPLMDLEAAYWI